MNNKKSWLGRIRGVQRRNALPQDTDLGTAGDPVAEVLVAGDTDTGLRRKNNEDSYLFDPDRGLFILCDGLGGMAQGEIASAEAVRSLDAYLNAERNRAALAAGADAVNAILNEAVHEAHQAVLMRASKSRARKGMATTVVVGLLGEGNLTIANLGDSRAYLIRNGRISILTQDHTVAAGLVALGEITPAEARESHLRNSLIACLGHERYRDPFLTQGQLNTGDRVILCSDGLWDMVADDEIARIVLSAGAPEVAVSDLIRAANEAGGHDNITVIALFVSDASAISTEDAEASAEANTQHRSSGISRPL